MKQLGSSEAITNIKDLCEKLEREKMVGHITRQVRSEYEAMAVMKKSKGMIPLRFYRIDHYPYEMWSGFGGTRELIAKSIGTDWYNLRHCLSRALLEADSGHTEYVPHPLCQQNIVTGEIDLESYFPVLRHYEKDNGRFVISGILVVKNKDGSRQYTSVRRMSYLGKNRMTIMAGTQSMQSLMEEHVRTKEPIDIALMFGVVPAVVLSSQINSGLFDVDKMQVAGALLNTTLGIAKCKTVALDVLADAQVVLEGKWYPWILEEEGPFGEIAYYYGTPTKLPVCEFQCMTYQNDPVWYSFFPSGSEEKTPMAISREMNLYQTIAMTVPGVKEVHLTPGGAGRFHAVVQIKKHDETDGKQAALAAFASDKDLKHVVVVDEDVDIWDMQEVEWAIATRVQFDQDVFVMSGMSGTPLDASFTVGNKEAKAGIDATKPLGHSKFVRTAVPGEENICLEDYLENLNTGGLFR